ncbi:MAG: PEGA domain-containing protein [Candidatus Zixiibacteriota bacterium]
MLTKGILGFLILYLLPTLARAQGGGLSVDTSPSGAEVKVAGAVTVSGLTPIKFMQGLEGNFKVTIRKYGYDTYKSSVFLQAGREVNLTVKLKPKTRFKAAARSLFIPGWGQAYTEQKTKGFVFALLAVGTIGYYFRTDSDFNDDNDRYDSLLRDYNTAGSFEEKERLYPVLQDARKTAYDSENKRRIAIGAAIAAWGINLIDVLFFFPEEKGSTLVNSITVQPDLKSGGATVALTHRF